ncbi:hypothetical protein OG948_49610 (plasmid) [Embleya sp. NBC_00888]|uniref:hypothetical protein n=1 Tax=Embleya sp. NBC_00888 TaxID=2975960 RepID=UPI002F916675|nr:hypothetical protein OG948_49610 [Embleya sp. NBC_00888]
MTVTGVRASAAGWPVRSASAAMLAGVRARVAGITGHGRAGRVETRVPGIGLVLHTLPRPAGTRAPRPASVHIPDIRRCAHVRLDVRVTAPPMVALARAETPGPYSPSSAGPGRLPAPVLRTVFAGAGRALAERARVTRELYVRGAGRGRRVEEPARAGAWPGRGGRPAPQGRSGGRPGSALTWAVPTRPAPASTSAESYTAPADTSARGRAEPGYGHPQAAPALTSADLPRLVDGVVREIDRRVLARQERRGWSR